MGQRESSKMGGLTLAYRDDDRTPVIFAIREIAARHYDFDVRVSKVKDGDEYEAALFNGAADVLIEHLEFLYERAAKGKKAVLFCAPSQGGGLALVDAAKYPNHCRSQRQNDGGASACRTGRGDALAQMTLWDLNWVKKLDDAGFIDGIVKQISR